MKHKIILPAVIISGLLTVSFGLFHLQSLVHAVTPNCNEVSSLYCPVERSETISKSLQMMTIPDITPSVPAPPPTATSVASQSSDGTGKQRVVTYNVASRGALTVDLQEFKNQVAETLTDARGWSRLGVNFTQVPSDGQFTVVLSEASQVPSFSSSCDAVYSCTVGRFVVINQDRWIGGSAAWNSSGRTLRDYRHMVINHETGHWLGHGHLHCEGPGQPAPVMQQQSINLEGCTFNPWPLASELYAPTIGIR